MSAEQFSKSPLWIGGSHILRTGRPDLILAEAYAEYFAGAAPAGEGRETPQEVMETWIGRQWPGAIKKNEE